MTEYKNLSKDPADWIKSNPITHYRITHPNASTTAKNKLFYSFGAAAMASRIAEKRRCKILGIEYSRDHDVTAGKYIDPCVSDYWVVTHPKARDKYKRYQTYEGAMAEVLRCFKRIERIEAKKKTEYQVFKAKILTFSTNIKLTLSRNTIGYNDELEVSPKFDLCYFSTKAQIKAYVDKFGANSVVHFSKDGEEYLKSYGGPTISKGLYLCAHFVRANNSRLYHNGEALRSTYLRLDLDLGVVTEGNIKSKALKILDNIEGYLTKSDCTDLYKGYRKDYDNYKVPIANSVLEDALYFTLHSLSELQKNGRYIGRYDFKNGMFCITTDFSNKTQPQRILALKFLENNLTNYIGKTNGRTPK